MSEKSNRKPEPQSKPDQPRRRAVAYVRMSTDLQQYSPENQMAVIERYAAEHDMEIVATYSDEARSGLRLKNRPGMRQMLKDAKREESGFDTILVYDISRWGRFQTRTRQARGPRETPHCGADRARRWGWRRTRSEPTRPVAIGLAARAVELRPPSSPGGPTGNASAGNAEPAPLPGLHPPFLESRLRRPGSGEVAWRPARRPIRFAVIRSFPAGPVAFTSAA
ncbi:MAG: recombinase family protein [Rhodospirillaceae bacterium]|nr:recombinase family protein [Rhodospirillaceae bacterium]